MTIWLISGLWILLGMVETAHIITLFLDRRLQTYNILSIICIVTGLLFIAGGAYFLKKNSRLQPSDTMFRGHWQYKVLFLVLAAISFYQLLRGYVPNLEEGTYQIALENITTGQIMQSNPFTGAPGESGLPMRMQLLCLPSLYSGIVALTGLSPYGVMAQLVPMAVWCFSMLVYAAFATKLFPEDGEKQWLFLSVIACLYLATMGSAGMIGYRIFHEGFLGETIRAAVLIPYTVYCGWQSKWYLCVLAIGAEACLVWTTYGLGYCALITLVMAAVHLLHKRRNAYAA